MLIIAGEWGHAVPSQEGELNAQRFCTDNGYAGVDVSGSQMSAMGSSATLSTFVAQMGLWGTRWTQGNTWSLLVCVPHPTPPLEDPADPVPPPLDTTSEVFVPQYLPAIGMAQNPMFVVSSLSESIFAERMTYPVFETAYSSPDGSADSRGYPHTFGVAKQKVVGSSSPVYDFFVEHRFDNYTRFLTCSQAQLEECHELATDAGKAGQEECYIGSPMAASRQSRISRCRRRATAARSPKRTQRGSTMPRSTTAAPWTRRSRM